jgi:hypothetical protein
MMEVDTQSHVLLCTGYGDSGGSQQEYGPDLLLQAGDQEEYEGLGCGQEGQFSKTCFSYALQTYMLQSEL